MVVEHNGGAALVSSVGILLAEYEDIKLLGRFDRRQSTLFDALGDKRNLSEALGSHTG